jgi:hypothetical protein
VTVIEWLLDADPAIRWQVMRDLTDAEPEEVAAERARVAFEGWGAQLLALQGANGNGLALANGAYFGESVDGIVERLLGDELDDGGWNCWAEFGARVSSFHTTICVLEGLLEWERAEGSSEAVAAARRRGEEYLLERGLYHRRSTGQVIDPRFTMFSFPTRWYYDVLRGLDYFRSTGGAPDGRCAEAIALVADKRDEEGRWLLESTHQGPTHFDMEGPDGFPSRWNTLRALRVLRWADSFH